MNAVIETEEFGRVYFVGSTSTFSTKQSNALMTIQGSVTDLLFPKRIDGS